MPTIVDALVVTLGLDAGPYRRASREAQRDQNALRDNTKKTSGEMETALKNIGLTVGKLLLGFEGLKGAITYFGNLNVATAELGRFAKNIGMSAHEVNTWNGAVELAGGSAKDAEADLAALSASITDLRATGTVSPLLLLFQRLGVSLTDAQGKTRSLTDLYKDLGDKLQKYSRQDAFNLAQSAGVTESTFNLIRATAAERERLLKLSEENNNVDQARVEQAQKLQEQWRLIGKQIESVAQTISAVLAPAVQNAFSYLTGLIADMKTLGTVLQPISNIFKEMAKTLDFIDKKLSGGALSGLLKASVNPTGFILDRLHDLAGGARANAPLNEVEGPLSRGGVISRPGDGSTSRNNNPGNIRYAGQREAIGQDERGFAIFPTLEAGIQAATKQLDLYAQRGINTIAGIVNTWAPAADKNNVPAYIAALQKSTGRGANDQLSGADRLNLLKGIFDHEGAGRVSPELIRMLLGANNTGAAAAAQFASAQSSPAARSGVINRGGTSVQIDQINVHTQAKDAAGVAAELPAALKRKGVVAQADSGMS